MAGRDPEAVVGETELRTAAIRVVGSYRPTDSTALTAAKRDRRAYRMLSCDDLALLLQSELDCVAVTLKGAGPGFGAYSFLSPRRIRPKGSDADSPLRKLRCSELTSATTT
jgi:hypothetical protein